MLMAAASQPSYVGRRQPGRPLLSSTASLSDSLFYTASSDPLLSTEPRFLSSPERLEDIRSAMLESQASGQLHAVLHRQSSLLNAPGNRTLDRRTLSVSDVYAFNNSLNQQSVAGGYRKLPDVAGWDVAAGSAPESALAPAPQRYKTELCRPFEENGICRYGAKCQFAHGRGELRTVARHPKYKTEMCRTFHTTGYCPYGPRCHFIHNDEAVADQLAAPQQQHHHHHQLTRQSSTPVTSSTVDQATATVAQKDLERRRLQLMQLHLQSSSRRRPAMDEISDEAEPTADWYSTANVVIDRRQPNFVPATSVPPVGWPTVVSSSAASSSPSPSSSSASSPVSSSGADHLLQYVVEPPPGLPIPPAADVFLRGSQRSAGGSSPTCDMTSSSIANFEATPSSAATTSVAYHQLLAAQALNGVPSSVGQRNAAGRPLLPANSLPVSFYPDDQLPVTSVLDRHTAAEMASILAGVASSRFQSGNEPVPSTTIHQRLLTERETSPCAANPEVASWVGSTVSERRAAFSSSASSWAKQTIDDGSSGTNVDSEKADIQQMMESLSRDQLATLLELVKACAPVASTAGDAIPAVEAPAMAPPSGAGKYGRSMSVNDPSMVASRPADGLSWAYRQAMTNSPNFTTTLASNRAAGVCG